MKCGFSSTAFLMNCSSCGPMTLILPLPSPPGGAHGPVIKNHWSKMLTNTYPSGNSNCQFTKIYFKSTKLFQNCYLGCWQKQYCIQHTFFVHDAVGNRILQINISLFACSSSKCISSVHLQIWCKVKLHLSTRHQSCFFFQSLLYFCHSGLINEQTLYCLILITLLCWNVALCWFFVRLHCVWQHGMNLFCLLILILLIWTHVFCQMITSEYPYIIYFFLQKN